MHTMMSVPVVCCSSIVPALNTPAVPSFLQNGSHRPAAGLSLIRSAVITLPCSQDRQKGRGRQNYGERVKPLVLLKAGGVLRSLDYP